MSVPCRSEALQTDAPLRAARFPAGKSLQLFWSGKEPDIRRLHLLSEKFPAEIIYIYILTSKVWKTFFFGEGGMSSPKIRSALLLDWLGCESHAHLCAWSASGAGTVQAYRYFDQFAPAGGSCGPVHDAPHPLPPTECAGSAPLPLSLGSLRKQRELWFLRNCAVASAPPLGRRHSALKSGGWVGTSRFGVHIGLVCILVCHFLTV